VQPLFYTSLDLLWLDKMEKAQQQAAGTMHQALPSSLELLISRRNHEHNKQFKGTWQCLLVLHTESSAWLPPHLL
jgi:hypothetical protein